jgi:hypothetical protein
VTRRHIIITGTGRAGTTLLVQLLTVVGLDTGFSDVTADVDPNCNAGMEWDLRNPNAPYIVKSPWMCDYLDDLLDQGEVTIDYSLFVSQFQTVVRPELAHDFRREATRT